jgi:hypothetical protein
MLWLYTRRKKKAKTFTKLSTSASCSRAPMQVCAPYVHRIYIAMYLHSYICAAYMCNTMCPPYCYIYAASYRRKTNPYIVYIRVYTHQSSRTRVVLACTKKTCVCYVCYPCGPWRIFFFCSPWAHNNKKMYLLCVIPAIPGAIKH